MTQVQAAFIISLVVTFGIYCSALVSTLTMIISIIGICIKYTKLPNKKVLLFSIFCFVVDFVALLFWYNKTDSRYVILILTATLPGLISVYIISIYLHDLDKWIRENKLNKDNKQD